MTTIVYDHKSKQVAIDSRSTAGNMICSDETEKFIRRQGEVWFFCGAQADNEYLAELSHNDKPEVLPDCSALMVKGDECWLVCFNGEHCAHTRLNYSHAIGSGSDFAISALDLGKTAKEAVEYAMTRDSVTGGKVHVYDIEKGDFV